jgi:hypothetical protein
MDIEEGIDFGQGINITAEPPHIYRAIFGYGTTTGGVASVSMTNIVSTTGVVANDVTGVGTARQYLAAAGYGGDKAIFGYGTTNGTGSGVTTITNTVSNTGVVGTNVTNASTASRYGLAAAGYGGDKAIFGFGRVPPAGAATTITTQVTNTGVVGTDTTNAGTTARYYLAAASYGFDKALFAYGDNVTAFSNKVSNTGVIVTDDTIAGTARYNLAAAGYGLDKAIFGYGYDSATYYSFTNLVDNNGDVASDTTGVGTAREGLSAAGYGLDKAIFGYGQITGAPGRVTITNLVDNNGVVATDTTNASTTGRTNLAAASFG